MQTAVECGRRTPKPQIDQRHGDIGAAANRRTLNRPVNASASHPATDVAVALVNLRFGGSSAAFNGCLHDLPAGTVIPAMVWGEFSAQ
jgi:hypothetical protein